MVLVLCVTAVAGSRGGRWLAGVADMMQNRWYLATMQIPSRFGTCCHIRTATILYDQFYSFTSTNTLFLTGNLFAICAF
jgi:hypothetical protein